MPSLICARWRSHISISYKATKAIKPEELPSLLPSNPCHSYRSGPSPSSIKHLAVRDDFNLQQNREFQRKPRNWAVCPVTLDSEAPSFWKKPLQSVTKTACSILHRNNPDLTQVTDATKWLSSTRLAQAGVPSSLADLKSGGDQAWANGNFSPHTSHPGVPYLCRQIMRRSVRSKRRNTKDTLVILGKNKINKSLKMKYLSNNK